MSFVPAPATAEGSAPRPAAGAAATRFDAAPAADAAAAGPATSAPATRAPAIRGSRAERKAASRARVLAAAARQLRVGGIAGTDVAGVMQAAGLSHGAFPVHFASKAAMVAAAVHAAMAETRPRWLEQAPTDDWSHRLQWLAHRYLTRAHRDDPGTGCALAALGGEAAMHPVQLADAYTDELRRTIAALGATAPGGAPDTDETPARTDEALALMALCVGGLTLARAVNDEALSRRILRVSRMAAARLAAGAPAAMSPDDNHSNSPGS